MRTEDPHLIATLADREAWLDELKTLEAELRPKELRRAELLGRIEAATRDIRRRMEFHLGEKAGGPYRGRTPPVRPKPHPNPIQNPVLAALAQAGSEGLATKALASQTGAKTTSLNGCLNNFKNWGWITRPRRRAVIAPAGIEEARKRGLLKQGQA